MSWFWSRMVTRSAIRTSLPMSMRLMDVISLFAPTNTPLPVRIRPLFAAICTPCENELFLPIRISPPSATSISTPAPIDASQGMRIPREHKSQVIRDQSSNFRTERIKSDRNFRNAVLDSSIIAGLPEGGLGKSVSYVERAFLLSRHTLMDCAIDFGMHDKEIPAMTFQSKRSFGLL